MNTLYLLTEDDSDSLFYLACAERITGKVFTPVSLRPDDMTGLGGVRAGLQLALSKIKNFAPGTGAHLLIALDNDRAPHALATEALPALQRARLAKSDQRKEDRYAWLLRNLAGKLGINWRTNAIPIAVGVPVEMLESWLHLIVEGGEASELPRFSFQDSDIARTFHHPAAPPVQLKDWRNAVMKNVGASTTQEWLLDLATAKLDPDDLAQRCSSFSLFKADLERWRQ